MAKLTATQEAFLKQLFGPCNGDLKKASKASIGSEDYSTLMSDELIDAIKKRADNEIAMSSVKATYILQKILSGEEDIIFSDKLAKVAQDILDRSGLSRQERPQHNSMTIGVVMLPNKAVLPTPPITIDSAPLPPALEQYGIQTPQTA